MASGRSMTHAPFRDVPQSDYRLLRSEKKRGKVILALRTDKPEAELYLYDVLGLTYHKRAELKWPAHLKLAETLNSKIEEILNKSSILLDDLGGIVIFKGPGSFTGLRIGMSVANALAYAQNIPIVARGGEAWLTTAIKDLQTGQTDKIAIPEYGAPANITQPRK
jgi:tRNA threonylcarbamoyladenosine biosynthesis protein TsaB